MSTHLTFIKESLFDLGQTAAMQRVRHCLSCALPMLAGLRLSGAVGDVMMPGNRAREGTGNACPKRDSTPASRTASQHKDPDCPGFDLPLLAGTMPVANGLRARIATRLARAKDPRARPGAPTRPEPQDLPAASAAVRRNRSLPPCARPLPRISHAMIDDYQSAIGMPARGRPMIFRTA